MIGFELNAAIHYAKTRKPKSEELNE